MTLFCSGVMVLPLVVKGGKRSFVGDFCLSQFL